mmetsp:Transcript_21046/g.32577  ORF Transcript_21046/g.32577 Transcript_21046/m.32577 type:complete len:89 (-) Transcript_21046:77-343(-)
MVRGLKYHTSKRKGKVENRTIHYAPSTHIFNLVSFPNSQEWFRFLTLKADFSLDFDSFEMRGVFEFKKGGTTSELGGVFDDGEVFNDG